MAKTFAPQLVRMLQKVNRYYNKHAATINATISPAQQTSLAVIIGQIQAVWLSINVTEGP